MDNMKNTPDEGKKLEAPSGVIPERFIKPKREYTAAEVAFAWICFIMGYLFCRVFPVAVSPLGGFLFVLLLFGASLFAIVQKGARPAALPSVMACVAMVLSASLVLSSNKVLAWLAYVFAICTCFYFVSSAFGNRVKAGFSGFIAADYINAVFGMPFASLACAREAAFSGEAAKKSGKFAVKVLGGIAVALIPTLIVGSLLSYDKGFTDIMGKIFDFNFGDIFSHLLSILIGILMGNYFFGVYVSAADKKAGTLTAEKYEQKAKAMRKAPALSVATACVPLLFVYVVFFVSQWKYYISGFTGVLPEEFSYAEYAREGFFQLCTVAFINLAVIIAISVFMRRKTEKAPVLLRMLTIVYSVFTLVLISTALAKMFMYIESYGLTQKRVYSTAMMIVLAVIFVLLIVKQFVPKICVGAVSLAASLVLFAVLSLGNLDGMIAKYNVDRYMDGSLPTVDIEAMENLGDAAVPELVRLAKYMDEKNGTDIKKEPVTAGRADMYGKLAYALHEAKLDLKYSNDGEDQTALESFFAFNLPAAKAEKALREIGLGD